MALAEERKVDALAARVVIRCAAFMTVTPYSVGEAYAVGANWLGGANIISGIIIGWWWQKCLPLLSAAIGSLNCPIAYLLQYRVPSRH